MSTVINSVIFGIVSRQDILQNESFQLDWAFKISLINDIVEVSIVTFISFLIDFGPDYLTGA